MKRGLGLLIILLMFPQVVETLYSPVLANIANAFQVTPEVASQTLSLYFVAFAFGVFFWGWMADKQGRRFALLGGLLCYTLASLVALLTSSFMILLMARMLAAFGAAVGSIVVQTIFRDKYQGTELTKIFSFVGIALAISPAIGMFAGGTLNYYWGYRGAFVGLFLLALWLLFFSAKNIDETKPEFVAPISIWQVACRMIKDRQIGLAVGLIATLNISVFSYYTVAPFIFEQLDASGELYGYTGVAMAVGSICGSTCNKLFLRRGISEKKLFIGAITLCLLAAFFVLLLQDTLLFVFPMMVIMMGYAMAIPIILSGVLNAYMDCRGTAGALLGLFYYFLIGLGLGVAGWLQQLGVIQALLTSVAVLLVASYHRYIGR